MKRWGSTALRSQSYRAGLSRGRISGEMKSGAAGGDFLRRWLA